MQAIIYSRVSTDDQGDNNSLPTQVAACRRYAEQQGFEVVAELQDVLSGSVIDRPGLAKAREVIRAGGASVLIVYSQDRLTRSVAHMLLIADELKAAKAALHTVSRGASADSPEGRLFDTIEASFAEYERLKIRERMVRGKAGKAASGRAIGSAIAPYGYRWGGKGRDKELIVDETEAAVIRQIYGWYLEGISVANIVRRLGAAGIAQPSVTRSGKLDFKGACLSSDTCTSPSTAGWGRSAVYSILKSPTVAGRYHYGDLPAVAVPAIIDHETWESVQDRIAAGIAASPRNAKRFYLLRGLVRCSCGRAMTGRSAPGRGDQWFIYYRCSGNKQEKTARACTARRDIRADHLEATIWQWVVDRVLNEDEIRQAVIDADESTEDRRFALQAEAQAYQRQIDAAGDQVTKLVKLFAADILTLAEVAEQKKMISQGRASAELELARVNAELEQIGGCADDLEEIIGMMRHVKAGIQDDQDDQDDLSAPAKRRILEFLQFQVQAVRDENGSIIAVDVKAELTGHSDRVGICVGDIGMLMVYYDLR